MTVKVKYRKFDDFVNDFLQEDGSKGIVSYLETAIEEFKKDDDKKALLIVLKQVEKAIR